MICAMLLAVGFALCAAGCAADGNTRGAAVWAALAAGTVALIVAVSAP